MANCLQWCSTTYARLRDNNIADGHTMPICLAPQCKNLIGVIVFFAEGSCVPISRGSPPISG